MAVGIALSKQSMDADAASLILGLREALDSIGRYQRRLTTLTTADLTALGYDEAVKGEVSLLKSAMGDMDLLRQVFYGLAPVASAPDFRRFAGLLTGTS